MRARAGEGGWPSLGLSLFCLCEQALSILKYAWRGHKARQGLSNWCLFRSWAYKARRGPISWCIRPPCCYASPLYAPFLACGIPITGLRVTRRYSAVLTQCTIVTDGRTDGQTNGQNCQGIYLALQYRHAIKRRSQKVEAR